MLDAVRCRCEKIRTALGGEVKEAKTSAILEAEIQGHLISTHALVIDEIGKDEDGKPIEILFGALVMKQSGIRPIPDEERLDLSAPVSCKPRVELALPPEQLRLL